jgi:hypothetical protein
MPTSTSISRTRHRISRGAASAGAVVVLAAAGCTAGESIPRVDFPSPVSAPSIGSVVRVTPAPSYTGYAPPLNAIKATFTNIASGAILTFPTTTPVSFTLTLQNTSTFNYRNIQPLIVMGQCTCNPAHDDIAPRIQMQYWDVATKSWLNMAAGVMGTGITYSYAIQTGSINLGAHASVSYDYRMTIQNTKREPGLVNGAGSLTTYILQMPLRTRLSVGLDPDATVPLTYTFK